MNASYSKRRSGPTCPRALLVSAGLLLELTLTAGCPSICSDDGFAWQQDPSCLAALTATEATGATGATGMTETDGPETGTQPTGDAAGEWCADKDMDGFGDPQDCTDVGPGGSPPSGTVDNDDDCDDAGEYTFPGAAPNDDPDACMTDQDGDDWGDSTPTGGGGVVPGTDCDDANMSAWSSCGTCVDADGDGWLSGCDAFPPDHPEADCDDTDPRTFPGAAPSDDPKACMKDADDDDWGDDAPGKPAVVPGTDCDDANAQTSPGAAPADDPKACMQDEDEDDHGDARPMKPGVEAGSDCYDSNPTLNPASSVLVTAPINSGELLEVDPGSGSVMPYASVDPAGIVPWIPTSVAVNPVDGTVYAALAFKDVLVTMNYCGGGKPSPLPAVHKKTICGITVDRAGQLYGIDGQVDQFLIFKADGSLSGTKPLTFEGKTLNVADCGMAYDCHTDRILVSDSASGGIYVVNPASGTTERVASLPNEAFGSGLEYDPRSRRALSCDQNSFVSIAVDGSDDFTQLPDLASTADDLAFVPKCN